MSKNSTSQGYVALLISVSLLIIIQAMAIDRDNNSLERPVLSVSTTFNAQDFTSEALSAPVVADHFEPGALSQLPGEDIPTDDSNEDAAEQNEEEEDETTNTSTNENPVPDNETTMAENPEEMVHSTPSTEISKSFPRSEGSSSDREPFEPTEKSSDSQESILAYTIEKGDSLWMIANKYKTSVKDLMEWNNISPNDSLYPGRKLEIRTEKAVKIQETLIARKKAEDKEAARAKALTYRVAKGDTLIAIAKKFHTSVASLLINNNIQDPGKLRPGQVIKISEANKIVHIVNKGESLWELGKLYSIKLSKLIEHNDLKYRTIFPGQKLTIPVQSASKLEEIYKKKRQKILNSKFNKPLSGRLCGYFGWRIHPILKKRLFHCGVDIAAGQGTPIKAIGAGEVTFAGWLKGYGKVVVVKHGRGLSSRYAHCKVINTKVGAKIKAGETIAKVGTTGLSTGPHLHLEVRKYGNPVDPRKYVAI